MIRRSKVFRQKSVSGSRKAGRNKCALQGQVRSSYFQLKEEVEEL